MTVLLAAFLDGLLREPPARLHPVVGIGRLLAGLERFWRDDARAGAAAWAAGAVVVTGIAALLGRWTLTLETPWRLAATALLLWPAFSLRMLLEEVAVVEAALARDLDEARTRLARLVSRDTGNLDEAGVRMAALETLAENFSDSLVAPMFYFVLSGLPGAWLYRYANTADATWGYRSRRYRHWGRFAARADDLLNLLPARLAAGLLGGGRDLAALRREAARTPSPNAGWPMAALALAMGVRLEKRGAYVLNPSGRDPEPADLRRALARARRTAVVVYALAALLGWGVWGL
ncbi:adenosylcobinamide-phosphate synthase CbiB [Oceanithermus desulfurans]|uniref:Cobalamin biosynthesis protein CobD n=2 Tax=Oceanithermus desulfurans TaxID=227924 RepID=A0A511RJG2_9DEIN|nr:adenosylcobinamide-phosphate synthase CbiB [Oceanithermus desulfurans]MBB6029822.1 adenosylcobinamide-phosphate synthase [Oceanithermus desulfurans]GEM89783.1 cobalamin biosynthesis protein CobD [Oceanithermus desulfurans NBRC 100063]